MNRILIASLFLGATAGLVIMVAGLAAPAFDPSKRADAVKTDDLVIAVRVPVTKMGAVKPDIPLELRDLRKMDLVLYDSEKAAEITSAIVVMIIPKEHEAELVKRIGEHGDVELLSDSDVENLKVTFIGSDKVLLQLKNRIVTALTPII